MAFKITPEGSKLWQKINIFFNTVIINTIEKFFIDCSSDEINALYLFV